MTGICEDRLRKSVNDEAEGQVQGASDTFGHGAAGEHPSV